MVFFLTKILDRKFVNLIFFFAKPGGMQHLHSLHRAHVPCIRREILTTVMPGKPPDSIVLKGWSYSVSSPKVLK